MVAAATPSKEELFAATSTEEEGNESSSSLGRLVVGDFSLSFDSLSAALSPTRSLLASRSAGAAACAEAMDALINQGIDDFSSDNFGSSADAATPEADRACSSPPCLTMAPQSPVGDTEAWRKIADDIANGCNDALWRLSLAAKANVTGTCDARIKDGIVTTLMRPPDPVEEEEAATPLLANACNSKGQEMSLADFSRSIGENVSNARTMTTAAKR